VLLLDGFKAATLWYRRGMEKQKDEAKVREGEVEEGLATREK